MLQARAAQLQNKKSEAELCNENNEKICFYLPKKTKENDLPPFTFNSIVKYKRNSGKSIQQAPDYMLVKPFERGANLFIKGYIHGVLAKFHSASETFYLRAYCLKKMKPHINFVWPFQPKIHLMMFLGLRVLV